MADDNNKTKLYCTIDEESGDRVYWGSPVDAFVHAYENGRLDLEELEDEVRFVYDGDVDYLLSEVDTYRRTAETLRYFYLKDIETIEDWDLYNDEEI